ncbi:hypothetical protein [Halosimplex sp. J119]
MVDDVSRRGVLLSAGAALSGGIATSIGSGTTRAGTGGREQDDVPPVRWHEDVSVDAVDKPVGIEAADGQVTVGGFSGRAYEAVDPWSVSVDAADGSFDSSVTLDIDGQFLTQASAPLAGGGRIFLGGRTLEPNAENAATELMLVASDEGGEVAWRRTYEVPLENFSVTDLGADPAGGAVFVGYSFDIDNPNTWVTAVDAEGEIRWEQELDEFFANFASGIEPLGEEGFLVYGGARRGEQWDIDRQDGWTTKIDAEGEPQWSQRYRQRSAGGQTEFHKLVDVVETDSGYLLVGHLSPSADDAAARGWAVTVDSEGERLYTTLDRPGTDGGGQFVAAAPSGDGYVLVGSAYRSEDRLVEVPWIHCVDTSLSTNWKELDPLDTAAVVRDAVATSDGGVAFTGNHDTEDGWTSPFVAKIGGNPVETPTATPTASPTPSETDSPTPTETATPSPTATQTDAVAATETDPDSTADDGSGFGVGAALAALGGRALLARHTRSTDGE